ncbi:MAG: hypothetical protein K2N85_00975 [Lachnospiraceae bacterium]|nr:hypothetical protein [Lachnospiraceae bacterium]
MRKAKFKKIVITVLALAIASYLLCLIFCTVYIFKMHTLNYNSSGWGVVLSEYKLDFDNDLAEVNYYDFDGTLKTHREDTFSAEQQRKVRLACAISLMPVWKSRYINPNVMDGAQWELTVTYYEKEKRTYGSNAYPLLYRFAYDAIRSVIDTTE